MPDQITGFHMALIISAAFISEVITWIRLFCFVIISEAEEERLAQRRALKIAD